jgi:hypothetical protein
VFGYWINGITGGVAFSFVFSRHTGVRGGG